MEVVVRQGDHVFKSRLGERAHVRGQHDAGVKAHQRLDVLIWNVSLAVEVVAHDLLFTGHHVGAVTAQLATAYGSRDSFFISELAAGRVDEDRAILHLRDVFGVDQLIIFSFKVRNVNGDDVAGREQLVLRDELAVLLGEVGWERVIGVNFSAQALPHLASATPILPAP